MSDILQKLGIKKEQKADFAQTLFYFIREFKINPLPEEYEITPIYRGDKIIKYKLKKLAMDLPLFNALMEKANEHYKKEEAEMKKARR